ncbi:TetR family transcriptional regulator [Lysinibacillus pakistanensis]|uniref:TetR family transcriptional regulator n=1 Tax=Lysinibacillus pakistanensis TaxID=759811 RepID=A0AAX3WV64_9BACI|nr:TetR family transcriptional regulator [Lysinibacillus pakistanensis]MDM5230559.1 TetR family transcriptional regulator [Lysinibacillus pakistanensis]QGG53306.1 TetR family transcriptional regulator [Lysinibacillus pakistanensis]WHY46138.1 TetR family transcriptional regulator [Lysinibacillus pakistanensis]WHY51149.1 TetR family transcriptional regulator [Lysinibacillus pakistanensis]
MSKEEKIIQAAIEVFREKGIEKTKVSDIVKAAGIAQGTFYLYFPSRLSVMPAIAKVMVEKIIAAIKEGISLQEPFAKQLEKVVDIVFSLTEDYRDVFALIYAGITQTEHMKEWENIYAPYYEWMNNFLYEAQQQGIIRPSLNTTRSSKLIIGLIESAAEQIYLYDDSEEETIKMQKLELLDFLHHALGLRHT